MLSKLPNSILLTSAALLLFASVLFAKPGIEMPESEFDFGRTSQHAAVSHRFWIKSVGDDTLVITKIVAGCGCTKTPLEDSVLAPGDSTFLEIIFSTKSYRGYVKKTAYLETNIGEEKLYLRVKSELLPEPDSATPISLSPFRLDVSQFRPKPRRHGKFYILNKDTVDYEIKLVDYADHVFDLKLPSVVKAGDSALVEIMVQEHAIETAFEHSLTFEISDENRTRYTLPVKRMYRVQRSED